MASTLLLVSVSQGKNNILAASVAQARRTYAASKIYLHLQGTPAMLEQRST